MRKVPAITAWFWIVKVLTTAFGESLSDYLVKVIDPVIAVGIGFILFAIAIAFQFRARRYNAWIYWFAVAMVAVFGTMAADVLHIGLGVPYLYSTIFFAISLVIIFTLWYAFERTLSIHSITKPRRELWYWLTVVATFALGTAAGDMTAVTFNLGYLVSGIFFGMCIIVIGAVYSIASKTAATDHHRLSRNAVLGFWLAYILTRPLGASFADWFGKAQSFGGLGWGDGVVSVILGILIIMCVAYLAVSKVDIDRTTS